MYQGHDVMKLTRYWLEFDRGIAKLPPGFRMGCGVTAYSEDDALYLLREYVFQGGDIPITERIIEDVDISTLDKNHVIPNMEPPNWRGIWFPRGFSNR